MVIIVGVHGPFVVSHSNTGVTVPKARVIHRGGRVMCISRLGIEVGTCGFKLCGAALTKYSRNELVIYRRLLITGDCAGTMAAQPTTIRRQAKTARAESVWSRLFDPQNRLWLLHSGNHLAERLPSLAHYSTAGEVAGNAKE